MMKLLLSTMGTDYYQLFDDDLEQERISFICSEWESLNKTAALYGGTEYSAISDDDESLKEVD